mmetsp:Transcript_39361/g.100909  ORF Transcript_39361/g.100909 Transcript_39361/m.100909 type:complete len:272 (-) Transcript_39361:24-839(-)
MTSSYRNWGEQPTETQCAFPEVDRHLIFGHGRQQKLKDSYGASLYSLVYANPENDKWRVDRYTWSGKKTNDKNVPEREIYPNNNLGTTKAVALAEYRKDDRYTTTSQSVHRPVSMEATERKGENKRMGIKYSTPFPYFASDLHRCSPLFPCFQPKIGLLLAASRGHTHRWACATTCKRRRDRSKAPALYSCLTSRRVELHHRTPVLNIVAHMRCITHTCARPTTHAFTYTFCLLLFIHPRLCVIPTSDPCLSLFWLGGLRQYAQIQAYNNK